MPFSDLIGHERPKAVLQSALLNDRVAHAYLFFGERRIGKRLAAVRFAQAINCDSRDGAGDPDACGVCRSCRQIEAFTHPDVTLIQPGDERATPQIKIEQIRELEQQMIYRPLIGYRKICLIDQADRMTLAAANALLKTLEEPPAHTVFVLIADRPSAMPATVRSRCQGLRFAAPAQTQVEAALIIQREMPPEDARFLTMATEGRIGEALQTDLGAIRAQQEEFAALTGGKMLASIPQLLTSAEALVKADRAPEALEWIARWVRDVLLVGVGAEPRCLVNMASHHELRQLARQAPLGALVDLLDTIEALQRSSTRNLNLHLALEHILLRLRDALYVRESAPGSAR